MTLLAAWLLDVGALAIAGTVVLHLLARNLPPAWSLPTARFVPQAAVSALTRSRTPRDLAVLIARVVALAAIAFAAAGPLLRGARPSVERIFVADLSRSVAARQAIIDTIVSQATARDRVIALSDRAVTVSLDSLRSLAVSRAPLARARLSSALLRAAAVPDRVPNATLIVVSPLARDVVDAGWPAVRRAWGGPIRVVRAGRIATPDSSASAAALAVRGRLAEDDPLAASLEALGVRAEARGSVALDRTAETTTSRDASAGTSVHVLWPRADAASVRDSSAAAAGLVLGDTVLIAPVFPLVMRNEERPGAATDTIVRWLDGTPAATEAISGDRCVRSVAIGVPATGDLVVRDRWLALVRALLGPCGGVVDTVALADSVVARPAPADAGQRAGLWQDGRSPDPWVVRALLIVAALALGVEWALRRRGSQS
ncbi:MAG: hypothetical protein SFW08_10235 [Gemmatimonadaceae bacterium]|nr:hypothetical protein [Gemmatimonadaceae bacterium]